MVALLTGAVMFALGLFFGWLLHRERVERALYDDVVRSRDQAKATLAETTARLELANKDVVRLRRRLMDTQHLLDARDAAVLRLEREATRRADAATEQSNADGRRAMAGKRRAPRRGPSQTIDDVAAAALPAEGRLFDQLDLDEEIDITEEVAVSSAVIPAGRDADADVVAPDAPVSDDVVTDEVDVERSANGAAPAAAGEPSAAAAASTAAEAPAAVEVPAADVPADAEVSVDEVPAADAPAAVAPAGDEVPADEVPADDAPVAVEVHAADASADAEVSVDEVPADDAPAAVEVLAGDASTDAEMLPADAQADDEASVDEVTADDAPVAVTPADIEVPAANAPADRGLAEGGVPGAADEQAAAPAGDDLRRINGVGPALERVLHDQGITTFRQLALLDDAAIDELKSREPRLVTRLRRGNWVSQARRLHVDSHGNEP